MWERIKTFVGIFLTVPVGFIMAAVFTYFRFCQLRVRRREQRLKRKKNFETELRKTVK